LQKIWFEDKDTEKNKTLAIKAMKYLR